MPRFVLAPVSLGDFCTSSNVFLFTADLKIDAAAFWSELNGEEPLSWCRLLSNVQWTLSEPHAVGSTRTATLAGTGTRLEERYFHWNELDDHFVNAFCVTATDAPGLQRFAERYEVAATNAGCRFTWTFLVDPVFPSVSRFAAPLVGSVLKRFMVDTKRKFC